VSPGRCPTAANARPETIAISQPPEALKEALPYDILEYIKHLDELPYDGGG